MCLPCHSYATGLPAQVPAVCAQAVLTLSWPAVVADLVLQTAANCLSMVISPAMPPYAARIAMQRTSSSSSSPIAEVAAGPEAEALVDQKAGATTSFIMSHRVNDPSVCNPSFQTEHTLTDVHCNPEENTAQSTSALANWSNMRTLCQLS